MSEIKVLVVDDSAYSRQTIRKMLETEPNIRVIGAASNGIDAMFKTLKLKPDLITLDIEMPEMDGFTFLRWLMKERPTAVIIVSSYSDNRTVFKALELGAVDFIAKPAKKATIELHSIKKDLLSKVKGIKSLRMDRLSKNLELLRKEERLKASSITQEGHNIEVIAVGASTGGPAAIQIILTRLPSDFSAGIVISQHMPRGFTASFAERLDKISGVQVKEAEEGDEVKKGNVLICPGGSHMSFRRRGQKIFTTIKESTQMDKYIPSVDTMMSSVSEHFGSQAMGVILTGMGSDGKVGMLEIKNRGGYTIAESEETAVVFGMPSEVINAGAADRILPISEIPAEIVRMTRR
ncbi:MAG: protein-glutamate methylesterase/protein-glutamine glutaminase [Nitrospirota bacterium]